MRPEIESMIMCLAVMIAIGGIVFLIGVKQKSQGDYGPKIINGVRCLQLADGLFCERK